MRRRSGPHRPPALGMPQLRVALVGLIAVLSPCGCMFRWPGSTPAGTTETGDTGPDEVGSDPTIGFVYIGPVGDNGWTLTHELGRQYLQDHVSGITTHYEPSVGVADASAVMEQFVADGDRVVITTSHDFLTATQSVAANNLDTSFLNCGGFSTSPNLGSYSGRMYQVWYLAGMVAASKTCTERLGVVAPVPSPEVVRHINAFTLGAREARPGVVVDVAWTDSWYDAEREPSATLDLISHNADVIVGHTHTTIPIEVSSGRTVDCNDTDSPVWSIGYDNPDACDFAPETCLTAAYWNWGPLYVQLVESILNDTWDPTTPVWDQMQATPEQSTVALAPMQNVDGTVRLDVEGRIPALKDPTNAHLPFEGPINDSVGSDRLLAGVAASDTELLRMCWFVEGVIEVDDSTGEDRPAVVPADCEGDH